ncbi:MAG: tape measure protein [Bacteroidota bacterium]
MGLKKDIIEAEFRTTGGNKLHAEIGKTESEIKRLNKENDMLMVNKKKLEAQNKKGTKAWKELNDQMKKNKETILEEKNKLTELNSKLKVTEMSARQLAKRKSELTRELNNTSKALNPQKWNQLNNELNKVSTQYTKVRAGTSGVGSAMSKLGALLPIVAFAALAAGAKRLFTEMINVRKEYEKYAAMLKVALGSQEAARREMQMLTKFAAETPFQLEQLTGAFVKLVNQGFKPSKDELTQMGDLAASMGKDFDMLAEAIIDAQTGEFERLKEFGIRASKQGDQVKFSFKGVETQVKFTADSIQEYIVGLGNMEGISGSMAEVSGTLGGRISNLKDAWDSFLNTLGAKSSGILVGIINWTIDLINGLSLVSKSLKEIKMDVMDDMTAQNLANGLAEIDFVAKRMMERGVEQAEAEKKAREMHIESLNYRITETKKALDEASVDEKEFLQTKMDLLVNEKKAIEDHFYEVAMLEKKQKEAYLETQKAEQEKNREKQLADLEIMNQEEVNILKGLLIEKEITQKQFEERLLELKMGALEKEKAIQEKAGQDTTKITEQILDLQIEKMNQASAEKVQIEEDEKKAKADIMNEYLAELDQSYQEELNLLKRQLQEKEITQQEYEDKVLELKIAALVAEQAFRAEAGQNTVQLDNEILDMELQLMDRRKQRIEKDNTDIEESHKKLFEKMQRDIQRTSEVITSMLVKRRDAMASAKEMHEQDMADLKQKLNEGKISYAEYTEQLGEIRQKHYDAERKARKTFQRDLIIALLDELKKILYIKIAEIWANEIASKSYWGIITAGALTIVVEGAYQLAKSKLSSGYTAGGPTGLGGKYEPAGVVHKNEYVIPEEGFFNPNLRPFINVIEEARKSGTLRSLSMAGVPTNQYAQRQGGPGGSRGFVGGGPTSPMDDSGTQASDPNMTRLLEMNIRLLTKLDKDGVYSYIGDKQTREIRDGISKIELIEGSVSR